VAPEARRGHAYTFDGAWFDIGTADSYLDAVEYALDGGTLVADDAIVENSDLGDVVHVMSGATVTDSTLERAVVFPNVTITDSEIRNSVIDEGRHAGGSGPVRRADRLAHLDHRRRRL